MNHLGDTNKMVSETPRTNQVSIRPQYGDEWDWCRADFARQLERELNAANERIKRLEEAHSWHPIETAPHDYNWVLGYDANDGETGMIIFDRAYNSLDDDGRECHWTDGIREWTPTHWMPLPDEPKAKEAKP
jgi:hypothetical protein